MSEANVEVIRAAYSASNAREMDRLRTYFDPDVVHRAAECALDDFGELHGIDALFAYYQDWIDLFDDLQAELLELREAGDDRVVARVRNHGHANKSGVPTELQYAVVYRLRDGLVVESQEYLEFDQALATAGLPAQT